VTTLALEGQETGQGRLLLTDPLLAFRDWVWGDGSRALFVAAVDANRNGVFDAGVDPQVLFLAERGRLTPLLRTGDPLDSGKLLSILSYRVNSLGQVAFQARIDRNGDGQFTAGVDRAGLYLLDHGRVQPLVRDGDVVGDSVVGGLDLDVASLEWQLNDRAEVLTDVELAPPPAGSEEVLGLIFVGRAGSRLIARTGLQTPFGTLYSALDGSLNNHGDVVFSADVFPVSPEQDAVWRIYRIRSAGEPGTRLEVLAQPGDLGPDWSVLSDFSNGPPTALADDGSVAFAANYAQPIFLPEDVFSYAQAASVQTPGDRYEILREGFGSPWGVIGGVDRVVLNDHTQAAVEIRAAMFPFDPVDGPGGGPEAILFWENGTHIGVVGAGDLIPGGQVGFTTHLIGLSNKGRLAFETNVTDDRGVSRNGIFVALVPGAG
jgi:hypothetical protein